MPHRPDFWPNLYKDLRGLFPQSYPDIRDAVARVPVPEDRLRAEYAAGPLAAEPDTFVLHRIIGNDLPPRHRDGQSLDNLRFLLEHEPVLPGCEKRWVVNRIIDHKTESAVLALLRSRGQSFIHLPFVPADYARIPTDAELLPHPHFMESLRFRLMFPRNRQRVRVAHRRLHNNYVMNNNGARNVALADGRARAKWALPFDGNCFFTAEAWEQLVAEVTARPWLKYFAVPMARLLDNARLRQPGFRPVAREEPQMIFRRDSTAIFNEAVPYGRRPKVELFWHLGLPGPWDGWSEGWWDQPRRPLSPEAHQFGVAGWVARLFSGEPRLEKAGSKSPGNRGVARQQAILALLDSLDRRCQGGS